MGCLFAIFAGLFPRLGLLIVWVARPALVNAAFDTFILPLLGIIFLPFATLIYVILYTPGIGLTGWGVVLGHPCCSVRHRPLGGQLHAAEPDSRSAWRVNA
jgi:hypothetical protein